MLLWQHKVLTELALLGARLRSREESRELFEQTGFDTIRVANFPDSESILEAQPV